MFIRQLTVRQSVLEASRSLTRPYPTDETMFLWTGHCTGDHCEVRTLVTPEVERSAGRVRITRQEMKRVGRAMRARGELLIVQVHTHPDACPISSVDEREAADHGEGALALVVHEYGQTPWSPTRDALMYERGADGRARPWRGEVQIR